MLGTAGSESGDLLHRQICIASIPACSLGSPEAETVEHPTCNCLWIVCAWGLNTTASSAFTAPTTCLGSGLSCLSFPVSRRPSVLLLTPALISAAPRPPAITRQSARLQLHPDRIDWRAYPLPPQQLPSLRRPNDQVSFLVTNQRAGGGRWEFLLCYHWPTDIYSSVVLVITMHSFPLSRAFHPFRANACLTVTATSSLRSDLD